MRRGLRTISVNKIPDKFIREAIDINRSETTDPKKVQTQSDTPDISDDEGGVRLH